MRIFNKRLICFVFLSSLLALSSPLKAQDETMTNQEVISLTKAGLDKTVIINKITASKTKFELSTDAIIQLKQSGVSDEVIAFMISGKPGASGGVEVSKPTRLKDELTTNFNRLKNTVVTVWSEFGQGTGFIFDERGLIMTNQHVVGPSQYIAVQFDSKTKVQAVLLAANPEKDVAILWVNMAGLPNATAALVAKPDASEPAVTEGERVFTIGSPLNQKKIITTGIVSKVEERAIISDVNINHGNSGGPLFNSIGEVVGITTFGDFTSQGGPGVSGIVRIEQAGMVIEEAKAKMASTTKPNARALPVDPTDLFPLDAIKAVATAEKFDTKRYMADVADFNVTFFTPTLKYRLETEAEREAAKTKKKRNNKAESVQNTYRPFDEFRAWREYIGDYKPILTIYADPELGESFWGAVGRGVAANYGIHTQARLRFKTDFFRMRLLCGDKEVEPILPAKIAFLVSESNYFITAKDATYKGAYFYPADAINAQCGKVTLELFSEKEPNKARTKVLDDKTVLRIVEDFAPYFAMKKQTVTP